MKKKLNYITIFAGFIHTLKIFENSSETKSSFSKHLKKLEINHPFHVQCLDIGFLMTDLKLKYFITDEGGGGP